MCQNTTAWLCRVQPSFWDFSGGLLTVAVERMHEVHTDDIYTNHAGLARALVSGGFAAILRILPELL
jgi:hypothetical protein